MNSSRVLGRSQFKAVVGPFSTEPASRSPGHHLPCYSTHTATCQGSGQASDGRFIQDMESPTREK